MSTKKFIADVMVGRLARWLRILGYDTIYYREIDDSILLKKAKEERRIIITRDTCLIKRNNHANQLAQTMMKIKSPLTPLWQRGKEGFSEEKG